MPKNRKKLMPIQKNPSGSNPKKPKKPKNIQKTQKQNKTKKTQCQFIIFKKASTQKKQKKPKENQCQFDKFQKPEKPKKPMPNLCFYTRVWFLMGWVPPPPQQSDHHFLGLDPVHLDLQILTLHPLRAIPEFCVATYKDIILVNYNYRSNIRFIV
jgi:hypothetical protein